MEQFPKQDKDFHPAGTGNFGLAGSMLGPSVTWAQNFGAPLDSFFRLEWEAGQTRTGQREITGYLYNDRGALRV